MFLNISGTAYEDIRKTSNSRYEYILPNIFFGKSFFSEKLGTVNFQSSANRKNYNVNEHLSSLTNDIIWTPKSYITRKGFINSLGAIIKNTNYEAKNTGDYKTDSTVNEFSSVLSFKSSLPMKKEGIRYSNIFSPNFMVRYAPGHMRNLSGDDLKLKYANIYSPNKTSVIENGFSAILGFDFNTSQKSISGTDKEKFFFIYGANL